MKTLLYTFLLFCLFLTSCCHNDDSVQPQALYGGANGIINFGEMKIGQTSMYLGFRAPDYYNFQSGALELTQDTLMVEIIGEDDFGFRAVEYFTPGSPALTEPGDLTDTAYYSMKIEGDSLRFDWDFNSPVSPRGRLFDYGVRYPMTTEPFKFDKFDWKIFPTADMPQFGITGTVEAYQPLTFNFGTCKVRFNIGTVFAHIERPMWVYARDFGLVARITELTPGGYAGGFLLHVTE
jgi:hypothetical protein